jgi:hypothetical protein
VQNETRSGATIGRKALIPNPALQPLSFLIGEWRTEGTHPMVSGKALIGRTSFQWHEGGAFLLMRSEIDSPEFPNGIAMIGSDDIGACSQLYFDERGVSRIFEVTMGENCVSWRRDDPKISQTNRITREEGDRLRSVGRISEDGGPWGDDLSQMFTRA